MQSTTPAPSLPPACAGWTYALRGAIAIAFGGLALTLPTTTVMLITLGFASYAFVDGLLTLVGGLRQSRPGRGWVILAGLLGMTAGALAWAWPPAASLALSSLLWSLIALWTLLVGSLELAAASGVGRTHPGGWLLRAHGAVGLLVGFALLLLIAAFPAGSLVSLGWLVGLGAIGSGLMLLLLAFRLRHESAGSAPVRSAS